MFLLIIGTACGLCALGAAIILQFSVPGWKSLAGLGRMPEDRLANVDAPRLRRAISLVLYFVASGCLAGALLLSLKTLSSARAIPLFFILMILAFNAILLVYRRFDRNGYSDEVRSSSRFFAMVINAFFILLCALSALYTVG